jgi:hypothetical protein
VKIDAANIDAQLAAWKAKGLSFTVTRHKSPLEGEALERATANEATVSKYRNLKTELDGLKFDSRKEARRYVELRMMERAGAIEGLELQVRFPLVVGGVKVCEYVADFVYRVGGVRIVEDCKGIKTPVYKLKKRLMLAVHGIEILET